MTESQKTCATSSLTGAALAALICLLSALILSSCASVEASSNYEPKAEKTAAATEESTTFAEPKPRDVPHVTPYKATSAATETPEPEEASPEVASNENQPEPEPEAPAEAPAPEPEAPTRDYQNPLSTYSQILWIGDSVTNISRYAIADVFPNVTMDAVSGRTLEEGTASVKENWQGWQGEAAVIELGANTVANKAEFRRQYEDMISALPQNLEIWCVNIQVKGTYHDPQNKAITELVNENPRLHLIDWDGYSAAHPEWFVDNVHPKYPEGIDAYVNFVKDTLTTN